MAQGANFFKSISFRDPSGRFSHYLSRSLFVKGDVTTSTVWQHVILRPFISDESDDSSLIKVLTPLV